MRRTERVRILRLFVAPSVIEHATSLPVPPQRLSVALSEIPYAYRWHLEQAYPWPRGLEDVEPRLVTPPPKWRHPVPREAPGEACGQIFEEL